MNNSALPCEWEGKEQGVEGGPVESLPEVAASRHQHGAAFAGSQRFVDSGSCFLAESALQHERGDASLSEKADETVDVAFASNFFEHLVRDDILATLGETRRVLRSGGRLIILQPNIRFCGRDYWMFFDHLTPIDDRALVEALMISGLRPVEVIPRFLPFTTQSRFPKSTLLLRLYLKVRPAWLLLGQQSLIVAEK